MIELEKLAQMSDYYGSDPTLVLAGGGNTSYKTADVLYVKASGFRCPASVRTALPNWIAINCRIFYYAAIPRTRRTSTPGLSTT